MNRPSRYAALFVCLLASVREGRADDVEQRGGIPITRIDRLDAVDFSREILPILKASCIACHNPIDPEADLALDTPEAIRKGGNGGAVVVPGESGKSRLLSLAAHRGKRPMPPRDNKVGAKPMTPDQLGLIRLWIDQGALGSTERRPTKIAWQRSSKTLRPILALAIAKDDRQVAFSRAGELFIDDLTAGRVAARIVDPELSDGQAHPDFIRSMAFSPDGDLLATGSFRTIKIWRRPRTARGASIALGGNPKFAAIRPGGGTAAFAFPDGRVVLHDLHSGKAVREFVRRDGNAVTPRGLAFSGDGSKIYSASSDDLIRVWNVDDGSDVGAFKAPSPIRSLAAVGDESPVSGHDDGQVCVWDARTIGQANSPQVKPRLAIKAHAKPVTSLGTLTAAPCEVFSASEDGWLRRWNADDGRPLSEFHHGSPVTAMAASPDRSRFASVGGRVARLWDASKGSVVAEIKGDPRARDEVRKAEGRLGFAILAAELRRQDLREVEGRIAALVKGIDEAKKQVGVAEKVLAQTAESARKPRAEKLAAQAAVQSADEALALAILGRKTASEALAAAARLESTARDMSSRVRAGAGSEPRGADLARAAEKRASEAGAIKQTAELAIKTADEAIRVADRKRGEAVNANYQAIERATGAENQVKDAETAVESAVFSLNTTQRVLDRDRPLLDLARAAIAVAEEAASQRKAAKAVAEAAAVTSEKDWLSAAFSADGSRLLLGAADGGLHIVDSERGLPSEALDAGLAPIRALAIGVKGDFLAITAPKEATIFRLARDWTVVRRIESVDDPTTLSDRVLSLDFHPDGTRLVSAGGEPGRSGELKIWDLRDGRLLRDVPTGHRDAIYGARFSNDGRAIATASADRSVRVFPVDGDRPALTLAGHANHVRGVAWSADDRVLASCGADAVVKLWNPGDGSPIRTLSGDVNRTRDYRREVTSIAFVGESDLLLTASGDMTVRVQSAGNPHHMRVYEGMRSFAYGAAATRDGKIVVAGGHDGVLRVWNAENGNPIGECAPTGPPGRVTDPDVK